MSSFSKSLILLEKYPLKESIALFAASEVQALIKSATASAWAKSILSLRYARSVNSPGLASLAPESTQRANKICITAMPPWP